MEGNTYLQIKFEEMMPTEKLNNIHANNKQSVITVFASLKLLIYYSF
jgi:hypothetical protein